MGGTYGGHQKHSDDQKCLKTDFVAGGVDPLLRGLYAIPAKQMRPRNIMTEQLTEFLFALSNEIAFDLGALNVQRGRDHGLPSYNDMREQ